MSASRVLEQLVKLIKSGRVSEQVASDILQASKVELVAGGKVGTFAQGMLQVGEGKQNLDPLSLTDARMPKEWAAYKSEVETRARLQMERTKLAAEATLKKAEDAARLKEQQEAEAKKADQEAEGRVIEVSVESNLELTDEAGA